MGRARHGAAPRRIALLVHGDRGEVDPATSRTIYGADEAHWGVGAGTRGDCQGRHGQPPALIDLHAPEGVIAFPGGQETRELRQAAQAAGLKVWRPYG